MRKSEEQFSDKAGDNLSDILSIFCTYIVQRMALLLIFFSTTEAFALRNDRVREYQEKTMYMVTANVYALASASPAPGQSREI